MKIRQLIVLVVIIAGVGHTAEAQPKKKNIQMDAPPPESILVTTSMQSNAVLSDLTARQPRMPLGPQDVLKSYEIAMNLLSDKTSRDLSGIVQAQQANQISREQAEYLLQERYEVAMMQYQVLSALHDVLQHDIEEASQQRRNAVNTTSSDTVLVVPFPGSGSR
jgi:hypothetical protein